MRGDYATRDLVAYIVSRFRGGVEGVKKLMKLVFLVQYGFPRHLFGRGVVKYLYGGLPVSRAEFFIWEFGPMSNEVYEAIEGSGFDVVTRDLTTYIVYGGPRPELPPPVAKRVDGVLGRYGRKRGRELEKLTLKLLRLEDPVKKGEYMGLLVDDYLERIEGVHIEKRELR